MPTAALVARSARCFLLGLSTLCLCLVPKLPPVVVGIECVDAQPNDPDVDLNGQTTTTECTERGFTLQPNDAGAPPAGPAGGPLEHAHVSSHRE
jgi:hypothetical protein